MEKLEVIGGLKNAIERGYSLEKAKQSFLNAGYNPRDVEDSANSLKAGVLTLNTQPSETEKPTKTTLPEEKPTEKKAKSSKGILLVVFLSLTLILLISLLVAMLIFPNFIKEKVNYIINIFKK